MLIIFFLKVQDQRMRLLIPQQRAQGVQPQFIVQQNQQQRSPLDSYDEIVQQRQHEGGVLQQRLIPVRMRANPAAPSPNVIAPSAQAAPATEQQVILIFDNSEVDRRNILSFFLLCRKYQKALQLNWNS